MNSASEFETVTYNLERNAAGATRVYRVSSTRINARHQTLSWNPRATETYRKPSAFIALIEYMLGRSTRPAGRAGL